MNEATSGIDAAAFDARRFMKIVRRIGHQAAIGIDYVAHGEDWAELVLPYAPELVGVAETGVLASGPIVSLMDMATSMAIWVRIGRFRPQATLDMRVDYLRASRPGLNVYGRGTCYRTTKAISFVSGIAHDGDSDDPIAHVAATFMATGE